MTNYAKLYRNLVRAGLCVAFVCNVSLAHAAYATLAPPPGWSHSAAGGALYADRAPTVAQWLGGQVRTSATIATGAGRASVPVAMRTAAIAGKVMAAYIFNHPAVRIGVGVASLLGVAQLFYDPVEGVWKGWDDKRELFSMTEWSIESRNIWFPTQIEACKDEGARIAAANPHWASWTVTIKSPMLCNLNVTAKDGGTGVVGMSTKTRSRPCPSDWEVTPEGCLGPQTGTPVKVETEEEFAQRILNPKNQPGWPTSAGWPFPPTVPAETGVPVPVEAPVINPGQDGKQRPVFVPQGDPVPNPNYNPNAPTTGQNQPYVRPGLQIVPSPTPTEPWRVDIQPVNVPQGTSNPADTPDPNGDSGTKPDQKDPGLCEMYPDILACAKPELDTPEGEIPKSERSVELDDTDLFGGGSCPGDSYANIGGQHLKVWDWQQSCDYITRYLKPIILLLGAFSALMIVSGGTKE